MCSRYVYDYLTQYLVGVATGAGALLLAYLRMFR